MTQESQSDRAFYTAIIQRFAEEYATSPQELAAAAFVVRGIAARFNKTTEQVTRDVLRHYLESELIGDEPLPDMSDLAATCLPFARCDEPYRPPFISRRR